MKILIDGQTFETPEIHRGIGIYTKKVINQMVKQNYEHEFFLAVSDRKNLVELDPWVLDRLHVIVASEFTPGADYDRNEAYTNKIQEIIDENGINALWLPNSMMVNVLFLSRPVSCHTFVTVYDLIPYLFPIKDWPKFIVEEYHRRIQFLNKEKSVNLIMISNATKNDWIQHIGKPAGEVEVTFLAADASQFYCDREKQTRDDIPPYILFTGGFDYRKNIDGAIDAYALSMKKHKDDADYQKYKLLIVGKYDQATKEKYTHIIESKGMQGKIELTGFVTDKKLAQLYHNADLFFFPSKYEGFGLPILEAMLSGSYVISANNSSLPEVCGGLAVLFNTEKTADAADALYKGYCAHKKEGIEEIKNRQEYALKYSWSKTALCTLSMIERVADPTPVCEAKPTLAFFTPWPNQKTGIANFEAKLIPHLQKYFEITIFTTAGVRERQKADGVEIRDLKSFSTSKDRFAYKLYQIGNNVSFHKPIFEVLRKAGGIAEIHDFVLTPFFYASYYTQNQEAEFEKLLKKGYGEQRGSEFYEETLRIRNHPDIFDCPMSESVVATAEKTIFHNQWSKNHISEGTVGLIPLPAFEMVPPPAKELNQCRKKVKDLVKKNENEILISCFGWVNGNKRPEIVIQGISKLVAKGFKVKLAYWGENNTPSITEYIKNKHLENTVFISGFLSSSEYYAALELSDVVVNLRYPSMGEASGTLCEALKMGKPVIVSDINQYQEYPNEVCWKLPVGDKEADLLCAYIAYLIDHPEVRLALSENAKAYADYVLNPDRIAKQYYNFITKG